MTAEQIENQEVWKQVKGAERLFEIYKYFPTLHDAKIRNIEINFESREFQLTVDYLDLIGESDRSIETRFTVSWKNVQKADFNFYSEDLGGMDFSRVGDFIKTTFENSPYDFEGELISNEIEITNVEVISEKDKNNGGFVKFTLK